MLKKLLFSGVLIATCLTAYASTPTLSLSNSGSAGDVLASVTGDANSSIIMYYYSNQVSGLQSSTIGTTNSSGTFWTVLSSSAYNVSANGSVYIVVNGQQSSQMTWPYTSTNSTTGIFSLSKTGIVLSPGQTTSISATNATSMYLYNNTNPAVVNVSINGTQINVSANTYGSTVFTVCSGSSSNCLSVYVTVQNSTAQLLTFSQSNVTLGTGQTLSVSIYGGSGSYTVVSNSNSGTVQASLSGSTVNLYGNSGTGQSSITVCTTDMASCGIINATIGTVSTTPVSFGQTSPTLSIGQTVSVSLSGSSGTYSVSSNSNSNSVQASISGNSLILYGSNFGTSNVVVCSSTGSCGSLTVAVSTGGGGGAITLSQTSLVLVVGQTTSVTISGGSTPYSIIPSTSGSIVQSSINSGNILVITGIAPGSNSLSVCSAGGGCVALNIVVNGGTGGTTVSALPGFSQSLVSLNSGQNSTISIIGSGGYYLAGNTNSNIASASISGSNIIITGNNSGQTIFTVCQSTSQCNTINVTVNGSTSNTTNSQTTSTNATGPVLNPFVEVGKKITFILSGGSSYYLASPSSSVFTANVSGTMLSITGQTVGSEQLSVCMTGGGCTIFFVTVTASDQGTVSTTIPPLPPPPSPTATKYIFDNPLKYGNKGQEVIELQKRLHDEGYFSGEYADVYGNLTVAAIKSYQKAHGLTPLGNLGPATRASLNK